MHMCWSAGSLLIKIMAWSQKGKNHYQNQSWPVINFCFVEFIFRYIYIYLHVLSFNIRYYNNWSCIVNTMDVDDLHLSLFLRVQLTIFQHCSDNGLVRVRVRKLYLKSDNVNNIMAWRRPGDKPLSEPMLTRFTNKGSVILSFDFFCC